MVNGGLETTLVAVLGVRGALFSDDFLLRSLSCFRDKKR